MEALRRRVEDSGQGHVFEGFDALTEAQRSFLMNQLEGIDFEYVNRVFTSSLSAADGPAHPAEPVTDVVTINDTTDKQRDTWRATGLKMIADGEP